MKVHFDGMFDDVESRTNKQFRGAKLSIETFCFDGWVEEWLMFSFWMLFDVLFYLLKLWGGGNNF